MFAQTRCVMRKTVLFLMFAFILGLGITGVAQTAGRTLKKITAFDLPGPTGKRFDYLTIDEEDHYLISAHLAAGQTYVINVGANKIVAVVTDTPGVEGVEYVPELKNFYTSDAYDDTIGVIDEDRLVKQFPVYDALYEYARQAQ